MSYKQQINFKHFVDNKVDIYNIGARHKNDLFNYQGYYPHELHCRRGFR